MKRIALLAIAFLASIGCAFADPYTSLYGNTLKITGANGSSSSMYVNSDLTYEVHTAGGAVLKGTYTWKDPTTACFTQTDPPPANSAQATQCYYQQSPHVVGDSWSAVGADGKPVAGMAIVAGR